MNENEYRGNPLPENLIRRVRSLRREGSSIRGIASGMHLCKATVLKYSSGIHSPLEQSQLAMVGARRDDVFAERAKERQKERKGKQAGATPANLPELDTGDARDQAGAAVGVSGKSIDHAIEPLDEEIVSGDDEAHVDRLLDNYGL